MNTVLIGYDLDKPGQDYAALIEALKSYTTWWHHLDSTWVVRTDSTATQLRDRLAKLIDQNDKLLVLNVTGDAWATAGLSERANKWLNDNM